MQYMPDHTGYQRFAMLQTFFFTRRSLGEGGYSPP